MKRVYPDSTWPETWRYSYEYDLEEVYGEVQTPGYARAYQLRRDETLRLVEKYVAPGSTLLDIAAAQGNFSLALAERGYRVTWNDLRADLAGYVQLKHERGEIKLAPGNAFDLHFEQLFDGVLITEVIEHVAHPDEFLRNTARLLRPGGTIVMTTPNGAYFRNRLPRFTDCPDPSVFESVQFKPNSDGHIFLLHADEIELLARQAGLELVETFLFTNSLSTGHVKTAPLLRVLPDGLVTSLENLSRQLPFAVRQRLLCHTAAVLRKAG